MDKPILHLCTPTENILSSHFFMFSGGGWRTDMNWVFKETRKSSRSQMFFRMGVFKTFAIFKGKHLSWSLIEAPA